MRTENLKKPGIDVPYIRRPRIPDTTVFSVPVKEIKRLVSGVLDQMLQGERLSPFSQQIHDNEQPQT